MPALLSCLQSPVCALSEAVPNTEYKPQPISPFPLPLASLSHHLPDEMRWFPSASRCSLLWPGVMLGHVQSVGQLRWLCRLRPRKRDR